MRFYTVVHTYGRDVPATIQVSKCPSATRQTLSDWLPIVVAEAVGSSRDHRRRACCLYNVSWYSTRPPSQQTTPNLGCTTHLLTNLCSQKRLIKHDLPPPAGPIDIILTLVTRACGSVAQYRAGGVRASVVLRAAEMIEARGGVPAPLPVTSHRDSVTGMLQRHRFRGVPVSPLRSLRHHLSHHHRPVSVFSKTSCTTC